ncbi:uncharacterized protein JN550_013414 [Neoarthrinium moseri]|uniref:uncharacterized protein n=1 Tax=Neoarthrinium moseri TaxID=1658444 RepID=UPI001FDC1A76|nr:uncharacterized protein JN550_013414 [Neoarthrinium moseri]KAI1857177.1 hypothetical protein JN550_013414 [Neoarthrinium moseri]
MLSSIDTRSSARYQEVCQGDSLSTVIRQSDGTGEQVLFAKKPMWRSLFLSLLWLATLATAFLTGHILAKNSIGACHYKDSDLAWRPSRKLARRHWHRYEGSINITNIFKGAPRAEIDAAWDRFTQSKWIDGTSVVLTATDQEMKDSGNANFPATVADLGAENGGGAMATLEMFHQLHCLNLLRKWTYVDYYSTRDHAWTFDRADSLRRHTDHCIDILRQVLMCNGDMGLVMFHWVKNVGPAPYPDFSTLHRCRDPVAILETAERHAAPIVRPVTKTSVAHELPTFP